MRESRIERRKIRKAKLAERAKGPTEFFRPRPLEEKHLLHFERQGWWMARRVLSMKQINELKAEIEAHTTAHMLETLREKVRELRPDISDLAASITEERAWGALEGKGVSSLDFYNLHRSSQGTLHKLVLGMRLGNMAGQLLNAKTVRVYQDCVRILQPGLERTEWDTDARTCPFDTSKLVTAYIPLQSQPASDLRYASGSHRDFALPFWQQIERVTPALLSERQYSLQTTGVVEAGDIMWHAGWTARRLEQQPSLPLPRAVLTITFIADGARLFDGRAPSLRHDLPRVNPSYVKWRELVPDGAPAKHALLPVTYGRSEAGSLTSRKPAPLLPVEGA